MSGDVQGGGAEAGDDLDLAAEAGDVGAKGVEADIRAGFDPADPGQGQAGGGGVTGPAPGRPAS